MLEFGTQGNSQETKVCRMLEFGTQGNSRQTKVCRTFWRRMMKRILILIAFTAAVASGLSGLTGSGLHVASAQGSPDTYAIRNVRIITVTGPAIESGTVVIANGKIAAVGATASVPSGAKVIDGKGLSVYPGMIDADTEMD
jgi:hypothetical protein